MILSAFTFFHVVLSLIGIISGFVVVYGLLASRRLDGWTMLFLTTTAATSATGFQFPVHKFLPSHGVGILSLMVLAIAALARYRFQLVGGWRRTYAISAVLALYFNVFVLIVQLFLKVPSLQALAPTQSEPPFQAAQLVALVVFAALAIRGAMTFQREAKHA
jgi:hypothetical protein